MLYLDQGQDQAKSPDNSSQVVSLVEKAKAGSRPAFEQLVGIFQEDIFRMVYYRTRSRMDAEDLTQEIFMQALKNLSKLKRNEVFRPWLFSIALNRVRDFHRKKRVISFFRASAQEEEFDQSDTGTHGRPGALDHLMRQEFWKQVGLFLDRLSRLEREVFQLRFMDYLSIREISQVLNRNESTVKTHLYRAIQKFRKEPAMLQLLQEEAP